MQCNALEGSISMLNQIWSFKEKDHRARWVYPNEFYYFVPQIKVQKRETTAGFTTPNPFEVGFSIIFCSTLLRPHVLSI